MGMGRRDYGTLSYTAEPSSCLILLLTVLFETMGVKYVFLQNVKSKTQPDGTHFFSRFPTETSRNVQLLIADLSFIRESNCQTGCPKLSWVVLWPRCFSVPLWSVRARPSS